MHSAGRRGDRRADSARWEGSGRDGGSPPGERGLKNAVIRCVETHEGWGEKQLTFKLVSLRCPTGAWRWKPHCHSSCIY